MPEEKSLLDLANAHISSEKSAVEGDTPKRPKVASNQYKESDEVKDILNSLLSKVNEKKGWVTVKLPTLGYLNPESDGTVRLRPFTFEDEKLLRSVMGLSEGVEAITTLLKRCIEGIHYESLSLIDKSYLLFKLREMSYGNEYPVEATCRHCGDVNELVVELDKIPVEYAKGDIEDPRPVELPDSEVTVYLRHPRIKHEEIFSEVQSLIDNLWKLVARVGEYDDRTVIQQFIAKTTAKDISVIRQTMFDQDLGLQTNVRFKCRKCGADEVVDLPMNENFFSVS